MGGAAPEAAGARGWRRLRHWGDRLLQSERLVLYLAGVYAVLLAPFTPGFLSADNAGSLLLALLPLLLVALGETLVLITGGIDLALPAVLALSSVAGAAAMNGVAGLPGGGGLAMPVGLMVMVLTGGGVGLANGLAVTVLRMPPFIVTLTTLMFFSGLAVWVTGAESIGNLPPAFNALGHRLGWAVAFTAVVTWAVHFLLSRTLLGRWLYAVGHNPRAAAVSGVPVPGVITSAYVLSGMLGALGAALYTAQAESGSPILGQRLLLDVVGAAVIGGTSLFGGRGRVLWTLYGVLLMKLIDNTLNLAGLSHFTIMMIKGGVILLAALVDGLRRRRSGGV